jgi:hypothetical protein
MVENEHLSDKAKQDLHLVAAARAGNQAAYADLLDRYRDSIYFMMLKMVKNSDDADDLTEFPSFVASVDVQKMWQALNSDVSCEVMPESYGELEFLSYEYE